ncbi:hypothetical protein VitviT2T_014861 [Vitis vinifera]|uniref:Secreted protein n=1 Tax=Vitis vinifera TaxID=29760 RepID=A0ABY9CKS5_VITVI|nr:hypothetical protein VitviT2T_014861 [Vitis vinifera]
MELIRAFFSLALVLHHRHRYHYQRPIALAASHKPGGTLSASSLVVAYNSFRLATSPSLPFPSLFSLLVMSKGKERERKREGKERRGEIADRREV